MLNIHRTEHFFFSSGQCFKVSNELTKTIFEGKEEEKGDVERKVLIERIQ